MGNVGALYVPCRWKCDFYMDVGTTKDDLRVFYTIPTPFQAPLSNLLA